MKIKTEILQKILSKVSKGVGQHKLLPFTNWVSISLCSGKLTIISTDGRNYLYVIEDGVEGEDFYDVVDANQLITLISKTTKEDVSLEFGEKSLKVKGNGTYELVNVTDENGDIYNFQDPLKDFKKVGEENSLSNDIISDIQNNLQYALAKDFDEPCYTNYYFTDEVFSTDSLKVSCLKKNVFKTARLITPKTLQLLTLMENGCDVEYNDESIVFKSNNCIVYTTISEGIDRYKIDIIKDLVNSDYPNEVSVDAKEFLQGLERADIFRTFDGIVNLKFEQDYITITNENNVVEKIGCFGNVPEEFSCIVDIDMLINIIKLFKNDLTIQFGEEGTIKLFHGDVVHIIALEQEEE